MLLRMPMLFSVASTLWASIIRPGFSSSSCQNMIACGLVASLVTTTAVMPSLRAIRAHSSSTEKIWQKNPVVSYISPGQ